VDPTSASLLVFVPAGLPEFLLRLLFRLLPRRMAHARGLRLAEHPGLRLAGFAAVPTPWWLQLWRGPVVVRHPRALLAFAFRLLNSALAGCERQQLRLFPAHRLEYQNRWRSLSPVVVS
jgi:hypothetical protein